MRRGKEFLFTLPDGRQVRGWESDGAYWIWSEGAPRPSRVGSRWDVAGCEQVYPVAIEPYERPEVPMPSDIVPRDVVEWRLFRAIHTDKTLPDDRRRLRIKSGWPQYRRTFDDLVGWDEAPSTRLRIQPTRADIQDYETAMGWLASLGDEERPRKRRRAFQLNRRQMTIWLRAHDWTFAEIGDALQGARENALTREAARRLYHRAIDRCFELANSRGGCDALPEWEARRVHEALKALSPPKKPKRIHESA